MLTENIVIFFSLGGGSKKLYAFLQHIFYFKLIKLVVKFKMYRRKDGQHKPQGQTDKRKNVQLKVQIDGLRERGKSRL